MIAVVHDGRRRSSLKGYQLRVAFSLGDLADLVNVFREPIPNVEDALRSERALDVVRHVHHVPSRPRPTLLLRILRGRRQPALDGRLIRRRHWRRNERGE